MKVICECMQNAEEEESRWEATRKLLRVAIGRQLDEEIS
jgi:hypothetical protein